MPFCIPLMSSFSVESMLIATEIRDLSKTRNLHVHVTFGQSAVHAYDTRVRIVLTRARPSSRVLDITGLGFIYPSVSRPWITCVSACVHKR